MTGLRWCRRTTATLAEELASIDIFVSPNTVARLLHQMGYSLRVNHKQVATTHSPHRNRQFEYLTESRADFQRRCQPVISIDTKKRELVGNFKNPGRRWERQPRRVYDHDFRTDSTGVAIPYGLYDVRHNAAPSSSVFLMTRPPLPALHCPLVEPRRISALPPRTPDPSVGRHRRIQRFAHSRLEDRTTEATRRCFCS
jgi:hypothetical protein